MACTQRRTRRRVRTCAGKQVKPPLQLTKSPLDLAAVDTSCVYPKAVSDKRYGSTQTI